MNMREDTPKWLLELQEFRTDVHRLNEKYNAYTLNFNDEPHNNLQRNWKHLLIEIDGQLKRGTELWERRRQDN